MKNISTLLSRGNLTPKERVLLWVANYISEDRDDKKILTETDKHALIMDWRPKDNAEAREYNRFNDGWTMALHARLDAQTMYLSAEISLLQTNRLVDYVAFAEEDEKIIKRSKKMYERLGTEDDARKIILKNTGLELDGIIYHHAFKNASEELKQDILALCPDAATESQYLDQEEDIATLFDGNSTLTKEAKEKMADRMVDSLVNKHASFLRAKGLAINDWWFNGYYGEVLGLNILKKWAEYNGVAYEISDEELREAKNMQKEAKNVNKLIAGDATLDKELRKEKLTQELLAEKIKEHAESHKSDIRDQLRQTVLRWLDEGLFVDEHAPIWNSENMNTCNDIDTKLPHKEVFKAWMKAKTKSKATLQKLIDTGKLAVEQRVTTSLGAKEAIAMITGESLYGYEGNLACTKDFRKQADDILPFGRLILHVREQEFLTHYASLLRFAEIFKRLSVTYEIDLEYKINAFVSELGRGIKRLNDELQILAENMQEASYRKHDITFLMDMGMEEMIINLEKITPGEEEAEMQYIDEFKKILGDDF